MFRVVWYHRYFGAGAADLAFLRYGDRGERIVVGRAVWMLVAGLGCSWRRRLTRCAVAGSRLCDSGEERVPDGSLLRLSA